MRKLTCCCPSVADLQQHTSFEGGGSVLFIVVIPVGWEQSHTVGICLICSQQFQIPLKVLSANCLLWWGTTLQCCGHHPYEEMWLFLGSQATAVSAVVSLCPMEGDTTGFWILHLPYNAARRDLQGMLVGGKWVLNFFSHANSLSPSKPSFPSFSLLCPCLGSEAKYLGWGLLKRIVIMGRIKHPTLGLLILSPALCAHNLQISV